MADAVAALPVDEVLNAVLELVIDDWVEDELTDSQATWLGGLTIVLTDLEGDNIAEVRGQTLYIDFDAAGLGWTVAPELFEALTRADNIQAALLTGDDNSASMPEAKSETLDASLIAPTDSAGASDELVSRTWPTRSRREFRKSGSCLSRTR